MGIMRRRQLKKIITFRGSDYYQKFVRFFPENRVTPSVAAPGDTNHMTPLLYALTIQESTDTHTKSRTWHFRCIISFCANRLARMIRWQSHSWTFDNRRRRDAPWKASHRQVCYQRTAVKTQLAAIIVWKLLSVTVSSTLTVTQTNILISVECQTFNHRFIDRECEIFGWAKTAVQVHD